MANIAQNAAINFQMVVWTGTNGADVAETAAAISPEGGWELVSESASQLVLMGTDAYGLRQQQLAPGDALLFRGRYLENLLSASEVGLTYRVEP